MTPNFTLSTPLQRVDSHLLEDLADISFAELCRACSVDEDWVLEWVEDGLLEGVVVPDETQVQQWMFTGLHLRRAKVAVRLQRDLGVNVAGAALALQLLDELAELRLQIRALGAI